jgi:DNA-directed RNA polymerase subunit RPC12/RpoP
MKDTRDVPLTDAEILLLDGKVNTAAQAVVDTVKGEQSFMDVGHPLIAKIIQAAVAAGKLQWRHDDSPLCELCRRKTSYPVYKSGYKKGQPNRDKPIRVPMMVPYVGDFIRGHKEYELDFCTQCNSDLHIIERTENYIREHELPVELDKDSLFALEDQYKCYQCGALVWEFDMGLLRAMLEGYYYGKCPHCGAEQLPFGQGHEKTREQRATRVEGLRWVKGGGWVRQNQGVTP